MIETLIEGAYYRLKRNFIYLKVGAIVQYIGKARNSSLPHIVKLPEHLLGKGHDCSGLFETQDYLVLPDDILHLRPVRIGTFEDGDAL